MSPDTNERLLMFWERVGGPTLIVVLLLFGVYTLSQPAFTALVSFIETQAKNMAQQTVVLDRLASDIQETRIIVQRDAAERKAETLKDIYTTVENIREQVKELKEDKP